MSETETEPEVEAQNVQMSLLGAVEELPADGGYRFAATQALEQAGYTRSDAESDVEASVRLGQPGEDAQALTGVLLTGSNVDSGRNDPNYRKILRTGGSLAVAVSKADLDAIGVDHSENTRPVVDVWAGEGVIAFAPIETRVIHVDTELDPVRALPDVLEQDYRAVVEEEMDPEEWAEQRGLTPMEESSGSSYNPKYYINQNVKKAKKLVEQFKNQKD